MKKDMIVASTRRLVYFNQLASLIWSAWNDGIMEYWNNGKERIIQLIFFGSMMVYHIYQEFYDTMQ